VTKDGAVLGNVTAVHNFGAGDLIEVAPLAGGEPLLLPFTEVVVPKIDMIARQITVVPPEAIE
jgi:16S rRNA processing protein RimM